MSELASLTRRHADHAGNDIIVRALDLRRVVHQL